jgi:phosphoglycerate dehydrogenase-like enzyme
MKILLTGAFSHGREQLDQIRSLGYEITFLQDEREEVSEASEYEVIVCNQLFLFHDIHKFEKLKWIQLTSAGFDKVPLEYINQNGIQLMNARDVYSVPMAEWVVLKILECYKKSHEFYRLQENHIWQKQREILELNGKTAVIIGIGNAGKEVAKKLKSFGVHIIGVTRTKTDSSLLDENVGIEQLDEVLPKGDIIVLTVAYNEETRHLINQNSIAHMKKNSVLVNVSRGAIIEEAALLHAVLAGKFLGVALDVFENEPLDVQSPLWDCENVSVTPHNSYASDQIQERLSALIIENLKLIISQKQQQEKRKDIVLIANYWHFETENYISRYRSFADILSRNYELEVLTSTFCHMTKSQREEDKIDFAAYPYKITLLSEPGYRKNICIKRIFSYIKFGTSVLNYMKSRIRPDAIIVSFPTPSVAKKVTAFANKNHIPVVLDIQDLWPDAFRMAFDIPIISNIVFGPFKHQMKQIYRNADRIMAVSNTYLKRALKINRKDKEGLSIYLGADSQCIVEKSKDVEVEKPKQEFWIGYVGSLGHSYDIETILRALKLVKDSGITNIVFQVMGSGVLEEKFQNSATTLGVRCHFHGLTEYGRMMKTLMMCDIAVNPVVKKSAASIINKVADYAAASLPVINTQGCEEYRHLLEEYDAGINVKSEDEVEVYQAILFFYDNKNRLHEMKENAFRLFTERFDRQKSYGKLVPLLESMINRFE